MFAAPPVELSVRAMSATAVVLFVSTRNVPAAPLGEICNTDVGVVVPIPKFPAAERKIEDVAVKVFVALKYPSCPVVPVRRDCLALKVDQSVDESLPVFEAEATGRLKVWVVPLEVMVKSVPLVELANVCVAPVSPFNDEIPPLPLPQAEPVEVNWPDAICAQPSERPVRVSLLDGMVCKPV